MKQLLRDDLRTSMRSKDRSATMVLRSAIAALDAAEAVADPGAAPAIGHSGDVERRVLTQAQVAAVLSAEIEERQVAIATFRRLGREDRVVTLERELALLRDYLDRSKPRRRGLAG